MATNGIQRRRSSPSLMNVDDGGQQASGSRSPSPEEADEDEMVHMQRRALELLQLRLTQRDVSGKGKGKEVLVEDELVDMVLRLTDAAIPLRDQVIQQAETIANLSQHMKFILEREEEERGRWDAEREGWSRTRDALTLRHDPPKASQAAQKVCVQ